MSKITKELKYAKFEYDEDKKEFRITSDSFSYPTGRNSLCLSKTYAFSLMRFILRISQKNWSNHNKNIDAILDEVEEVNPNQLNLFE
jgi:hypothetical protein